MKIILILALLITTAHASDRTRKTKLNHKRSKVIHRIKKQPAPVVADEDAMPPAPDDPRFRK